MVEATGKPTDISKIQDIMNAISSNDSSDKTGLMVDYAAGSKLESNILALKGIAIQQAGYLKKMVDYQETMIGNARREDVSSVASASKKDKKGNKDEEENRYDSLGTVLATAGSAGLLSLLGPLGLQAAAGMLFRGGAGNDKLAGGAGNDKVNDDADKKPKTTADAPDADTKRTSRRSGRLPANPVRIDYTSADFGLGEKPKLLLTKEMQAAISNYKGADFELGKKPPLLLTDPINNDFGLGKKPTLQLTKEMRAAISGTSPLSLTEQMRVKPKISDAQTKGVGVKGAGALGAVLSGGMGYFDKELKDSGLNSIERIGQGLLESIPGAIDMFTRGLVTDPLNSAIDLVNGFTGKGPVAEEDKFNYDITPLFRKFMLEEMSKTKSDNSTMTAAPNRMAAFKAAMAPTTVPNTTITPPPAAPIVIAPPAAPASSVVNSNNRQTTIINQTKDVSASLYSQMLGGD